MNAHELAATLKNDQTVWSKNARNSDGTATRYRITCIKTWKRDPNRLYIGFKWGLYTTFQVHSVEQFDRFITTAEPIYPKPEHKRKK